MQLLILLPIAIFIHNQTEFSLGLLDLLPLLIAIAVGAFIAIILIAAFLPERLSRALTVVLLGLSILTYVQANLMPGNYGQFDGQDIKWSEFQTLLIVDLAFWIIGCFVIAALRAWLFRQRVRVALAPVLLSCLTLAPELLQGAIRWHSTIETEQTKSFFDFSPHKNIIVIVLDAFASPAFETLVEKEPALSESFRGFTYYRNTVAGFPTTSPSIPEILSGQLYANDRPFSSFLENALRHDSLPSLLYANSYQVDLVTLQHYCFHLQSSSCLTLGDLMRSDRQSFSLRESAELLDVTLFRVSPQPIKRLLYNQQDWFLQNLVSSSSGPRHQADSIQLVSQIEREAKLGQSAQAFKFIHLLLPHAPIRTNASCEFLPAKAPSSQRNYLGQARCALLLVERLFATWKRLGIFDSSTIIVLADHGAQAGFTQLARTKDYPRLVKALPLLLVKPANSNKDLHTSRAPAHLIDVATTAATLAGIESRFPGRILGELKEDESRQRSFSYYSWKDHMWSGESLPPTTRYSTTGDAWDFRTWRQE
ncbi:MAG: LTA synthase family protein [Oligoflexia bacterium]|nr:LTA synthase family protein [Oligoflexia bacterium]